MPRKSKSRFLCDLLTDSYLDSVMIGLSDLMEKDLAVYEEVMHSILRSLISFQIMQKKTYEHYNMKAILRFSAELAEVFEIEKRDALRILISPLYDDVELLGEELLFIEYLIGIENYEIKLDDIRRDINEGKLSLSSVDGIIKALTDKLVINFIDNTVYLIIGRKASLSPEIKVL